MKIKNARATERHSEQNKPDPDAQINIAGGHDIRQNVTKPVSKNEAFATVLLKQPNGVNALDTNARSVDDFDMIGSGAKFYTTCLHSDVSKFRNQHGVDIVGENERYQSHHGYSAHFIRYRLPNRKAALRALTLINRWRAERGVPAISEGDAQFLVNQFPGNAAE
ncbi:hypothetical protein HVY04_17975 [Citrobacter freundii]|uniref:hypothetical protein n=1 Tax=Citrobacter freundii TaxID=546 RepID=UPI0015EA6A60|nr:hypothetical protein [Citrobacter freundii]QMJ04908.1 hypothetical protein HVY06_17995 [Citrobacter freundii]QMJ13973.1 hypothetical protein HVY04_17975 [Citrobacter freundii]